MYVQNYRTTNRKQLGRIGNKLKLKGDSGKKTASVGAEVTAGGRLSQRWLPATW